MAWSDLVAGSSTNNLHNVLFAVCEAGIGASSNSITIKGEQVTADVADFCLSPVTPSLIALTNSIVWGNSLSASTVASINVAMNPDNTNFVSVGEGNYYLVANSPLHHSGTAGISQRLQTELQGKTTYPPVAIAPFTQISGQMTLAPQAQRYTNSAPDLGYYYDALDYTVANFTVAGGNLTVLPGTAVGIRNDDTLDGNGNGYVTIYGFYVSQGGTVTSHGTPNKPNIFVAADLVQETPNLNFAEFRIGYSQSVGAWLPGILSFTSDFEPGETTPPTLDFRFSHFYLPATDLHFCSGLTYDFWAFSISSCVNLNLQDCALYDGYVNVGQPYYDNINYFQDYPYGSSAVTWNNTLFENVSINLDPTYYETGADDQGLNVDMSLQAGNNLFRGGQWLHLEPIPASAGNWVFENNLFDQVNLIQDNYQPLDFDYNGYWPLTADSVGWLANLNPWAIANTNYLQNTTTLDGFVDSHNEQFLDAAPPYQSSTLGKYYLPDNTPLYGGGSTTAAAVGLYHYTTRIDQNKEGNEPLWHNVNIGLHYVAATNGVPIDTDGDGIPDYVENWHGDGNYSLHTDTETDWQNPTTGTDPITGNPIPDAYNTVYDDVDLDGDGLTGRAERILGTNPLVQDNPLTLVPVITGQEPYILTYSMPLSVDVSSNDCALRLTDNGSDAGAYDFIQQTNGTYMVEWNTTFASNGPHFLQVGLDMPGFVLAKDASGAQPVLSVAGQTRIENINNPILLDLDDTSFGSQAVFTGTLTVQSADYEIDIYDTNNTLLNIITNHTDNGVINEVWNLTITNGETRDDEEFDAQLYITPSDTSNNSQAGVHANGLTRSSPIPIWRFRKLFCGDLFSLAYGWDSDGYFAHQDRSAMIMDSVENIIFSPALDNQYYNTSLNGWDHEPFYMSDATRVLDQPQPLSASQETLVEDLANQSVGNFFWHGHGSPTSIGSGSAIGLDPDTIGERLGNLPVAKRVKGPRFQHPYRLVILDACECAKNPDWPKAFGIIVSNQPASWFQSHGEASQAMLAWPNAIDACEADPLAGTSRIDSHGEHLADFFGAWMSGASLAECVSIGTIQDDNWWPFDRPLDPNWKIFGDPFMTRSP